MANPITIKKRTMTVKRSGPAAKPEGTSDQTSSPDETTGEAVPDTELADSPVFLSSPKPTGGRGAAQSSAFLITGVVALITLLVFLFILFLQWTELRELNQLIPRPVQVSMIALHSRP